MEVGQVFVIDGADYRIASISHNMVACEYTSGVNPVMFGGDGEKIWNKNYYTYFSADMVRGIVGDDDV